MGIHYLYSALVPFTICFLIGPIFMWTYTPDPSNAGDFFPDDYSLEVLGMYLLSGIITLSALPIFLLNIPQIRNNRVARLLSWFLIPVLTIRFFVWEILKDNPGDGIRHIEIHIIIVALIFLVGLVWGYGGIYFNKEFIN